MSSRRLLRVGLLGSVIAALCCFTPVLVILLSAVGANAAVIWDEAIDGDLSGDYLNPTVVVPTAVDNQLLYSSASVDRERWLSGLACEGLV